MSQTPTVSSTTMFTLGRWDEVASVITVRGSIGAGKTTVMGHLERYLVENDLLATSETATADDLFLPVPEPLNDWQEAKYRREPATVDEEERDAMCQSDSSSSDGPLESMFQKMCRDKRRYGFSFQVMAFTTRMAAIADAMAKVPRRQRPVRIHVIPERFLPDDRLMFENLYEMGYIEPCEWDIYNGFYALMTQQLVAKEKAMIYVPTSPEICLERVAKRDRAGETDGGVPLGYLRALERKHDQMEAAFTGHVWRLDTMRQELTASEIGQVCWDLMHEIVTSV